MSCFSELKALTTGEQDVTVIRSLAELQEAAQACIPGEKKKRCFCPVLDSKHVAMVTDVSSVICTSVCPQMLPVTENKFNV